MSFLEDIIRANAPASVQRNPDHVRTWAMENLHGKNLNQIKTELTNTPYFGLNQSNFYHYASDFIQGKRREEGRNLTMGEQMAITDTMRQLANAPTQGYILDEHGRAKPRNFRSEIAGKMNQSNWWRNMSSNALYSLASLPSRAVGLMDPELGTAMDNHYLDYYNPQDAPGATTGRVIAAAGQAVPLIAGGIPTLIGLGAYAASGAGEARMTAADQRLLGHDISGLQEASAATLKGGIEVVSGLLTRGLAKVSGRAAYPVLAKVAPKLVTTLFKGGAKAAGKSFARSVATFIGASLGEGAEEAATEVFQNFVDQSILEVEKDIDEGAGEAFKIGVLTNMALSLLTAGRVSGVQTQFNLKTDNAQETVEPAKEWEFPEDDKPIEPTEGLVKATQSQQALMVEMRNKLELKDKEFEAIASKLTGKKSIGNMLVGEAQDVIDAMSEVADLKFREPTVGHHITAQLYEAERLGLGSIIKPLADADINRIMQTGKAYNQVDAWSNQVNQLAGISKRQARKLHRQGRVTEAESHMAKLLDTHEEAPEDLSKEETNLFNEMRNYTQFILTEKNKARAKEGLEPIPYRTGYIPHIAEETAQAIKRGDMDHVPQDILYWMKKKASTEIYDPREFERQLAEKIGERFSTDLNMLLKTMSWTGMKDIHLRNPLTHWKQQVELMKNVIPANTRQWMDRFVAHSIKKQQTTTDAHINNIVNATGLKGLINKVLRPFGTQIVSKKPLTDFFQTLGRMNIYGTMAFRPKLWIRNTFQRLQNIALYGVKNTIKGSMPSNDPALNELLDKSTFLLSYTGVEDLNAKDGGVLKRFGLGVYQWTATANAKSAMKAAYYSVMPLITDPKHKDLGWADPRRTGDEPKGFLYDSEKQVLLKEMEFGAGATQYQYIGVAMPSVFRHKAMVPFTRLQSWWMNYFMQFNREAMIRTFTGKTGYGKSIPASWRANYAKYTLFGGAILQHLGYGASFMAGAAPATVAPTAMAMWALYMVATADREGDKKKAWAQFTRALQTFVPGGLAIREIKQLLSGEKDLTDYFFYKKKKEK